MEDKSHSPNRSRDISPSSHSIVIQDFEDKLGRQPLTIVCKDCGHTIETQISRHNGLCSIFATVLMLVFCAPCFFIPLIIPTCKDTLHTCPNCDATIGIHGYLQR